MCKTSSDYFIMLNSLIKVKFQVWEIFAVQTLPEFEYSLNLKLKKKTVCKKRFVNEFSVKLHKLHLHQLLVGFLFIFLKDLRSLNDLKPIKY